MASIIPYLEVDFDSIDEKENDHDEEQHGIAAVEHVLVEGLEYDKHCLSTTYFK